jgi:hypothetical protein
VIDCGKRVDVARCGFCSLTRLENLIYRGLDEEEAEYLEQCLHRESDRVKREQEEVAAQLQEFKRCGCRFGSDHQLFHPHDRRKNPTGALFLRTISITKSFAFSV